MTTFISSVNLPYLMRFEPFCEQGPNLLTNLEGEKTDGRIRCRFQRAKTLSGSLNSPDNADFTNEYYIFLAKGIVDKQGNKERHTLEPNKYPYVSKQKVKLTNDVDIDGTARYFYVKAHGE